MADPNAQTRSPRSESWSAVVARPDVDDVCHRLQGGLNRAWPGHDAGWVSGGSFMVTFKDARGRVFRVTVTEEKA